MMKSSRGAITLEFNLKPGTTYTYKSEVDQKIEAMGMGSSSYVESEYSYHVKESKDGNITMETTYDKMKMKMKTMGMNVTISSEDDTKESKALREMVGKPFAMTVDKSGNIINIENFDFIDKSDAVNEQDLKNMMETSLNIYPDHPVKIGDEWVKETKTDFQNFKMNIRSTYKLVAVDGNIATLEFNGDINMNEGDNKEMKNGDMEMNMKGTQKGNIEVDIPTGMAVKGAITQDIKGEMKMQGQTVPMSIESKIKMNGKVK